MSIILSFLTVIAVIVVSWLSRQRLGSKPWLETGLGPVPSEMPRPPSRVGLWVFLAVVGGLFALFASAFTMRTDTSDWQQLQMPPVIWLNTVILFFGSVFLHFAAVAARNGDARSLRANLAAGGLSTVGFLGGQLLAWQALVAEGLLLAGNPAVSFFYVITGLHGLHIFGGLVGLGRVGLRLWSGTALPQLREGVQLCATYWHFLFGVWIALVAVMLGWAGQLIEICRASFT